MVTLSTFCELFYQHSHHGIMPCNVLLLHIGMRAFKQNVSRT